MLYGELDTDLSKLSNAIIYSNSYTRGLASNFCKLRCNFDSANHVCTLVQAVVMVTTVLLGKGHFWTAGNEKPQKQSSHAWNITLLSLFWRNIHLSSHLFPSLESPFVLRTSTGRTPEPIMMVDSSNDAFWLEEVPFGYAHDKKNTWRGSTNPKTLAFFDPVGESQPKL